MRRERESSMHPRRHRHHWLYPGLSSCGLPDPVFGPPPLSPQGAHLPLAPPHRQAASQVGDMEGALLSRGERLALVRQVLTAMPVHILLAMALSPPILKKANRFIRDFLWHGRKDARAGCCLVSWARVCRPLELGGLGIRDLHRTGISLRVRWLWLHASDASRPWSHLQPPSDPEALQFFRASTTWTIGNGTSC